MDEQGIAEVTAHIQNHVTYPATKQTLVESCNNMEHVPEETRNWFSENLPAGTYQNSEQILHVLGLPHSH